MFVSGDYQLAKNTVADLFESFGFAPVDLGSLKSGGRIQAVGGPIAGHDLFLPWPHLGLSHSLTKDRRVEHE